MSDHMTVWFAKKILYMRTIIVSPNTFRKNIVIGQFNISWTRK